MTVVSFLYIATSGGMRLKVWILDGQSCLVGAGAHARGEQCRGAWTPCRRTWRSKEDRDRSSATITARITVSRQQTVETRELHGIKMCVCSAIVASTQTANTPTASS